MTKILATLAQFFIGLIVLTVFLITVIISYYNSEIPDYRQLVDYTPPTITKVFSADGVVLREYAKEKRIFVPGENIPKLVKDAFLAAEDKNFYTHPGIDFLGIIRAVWNNVVKDIPLQGASTITQQVAKNLILSDERTVSRKIREAILSFRITSNLSKDKILELYLNEIYLGSGAYGVAQAAHTYFGKTLDSLNIQEAALLAAMPKAPSTINPWKNYDRALERRNWVINSMYEAGFITSEQLRDSIYMPIELKEQQPIGLINEAGFFAEEVRLKLLEMYKEKTVYENGLNVVTTLSPKLQRIAEQSLRKGIISYDMRHGYRGPLSHLQSLKNWQENLVTIIPPKGYDNWRIAVILNIHHDDRIIEIGFSDSDTSYITFDSVNWALKSNDGKQKNINEVFKDGDVIFIEKSRDKLSPYELRQIPEVNGALVAIDPSNGHVLAIVGGYTFENSKFNRATQAKRQPGSAFKPFVYLTAFVNGFTPANLIEDEPIEFNINNTDNNTDYINEKEEEKIWSPRNYSGYFYGPTTLRQGVEKSINVMTVKLAMVLGIDKIINTAKNFGIYKSSPPRNLSTILGSAETDLLSLTNAYAILANGGQKISPTIIQKITDRNGKMIFESKRNKPERIMDEKTTYQLISVLEGVVKRGTAKDLSALGIPLAGKTGTTNNFVDAWFVGFTPDLAVGVYVGYDTPKTLGRNERGSTVALPIFTDFIKEAVKGQQIKQFPIPDGIKLVRIDSKTGFLPSDETPENEVIIEAFKVGTEPTKSVSRKSPVPVIDSSIPPSDIEQLQMPQGIY